MKTGLDEEVTRISKEELIKREKISSNREEITQCPQLLNSKD